MNNNTTDSEFTQPPLDDLKNLALLVYIYYRASVL
jgi:hypothetical protein